MAVKGEKLLEIKKRMADLGISDNDLEEKFILASKKGGQKVQKTSSCVYLKHLPTGIEVKCQKDRLRETNRLYARRLLCDIYEEKILNIKTKKQIKLEKIKKQKTRRKRRSKEKYG
jgi:peptide chain release factor